MSKLKNRKFVGLIVVGLLVLVAAIVGIYFIPNEKLSDILLTIFAALISGSLTLSGVAWTIKSEREKDRLEEKKKAKPLFVLRIVENFDSSRPIKGLCCEIEESKGYKKWYAYFQNFTLSCFYIVGIKIDNKFYELKTNKTVLPNQYFTLVIHREINANENDNSLLLIIEDILHEKYYYQLKFGYDKLKGTQVYNFAYEMSEITKSIQEENDTNGHIRKTV